VEGPGPNRCMETGDRRWNVRKWDETFTLHQHWYLSAQTARLCVKRKASSHAPHVHPTSWRRFFNRGGG